MKKIRFSSANLWRTLGAGAQTPGLQPAKGPARDAVETLRRGGGRIDSGTRAEADRFQHGQPWSGRWIGRARQDRYRPAHRRTRARVFAGGTVLHQPGALRARYRRDLRLDLDIFASVAEVPEAGDYLTIDIGAYSVIVIRDDDGEIRAHHNVCRHRGTRLLKIGRASCRERV